MKKHRWIFAVLLFVVMMAGIYLNQRNERNMAEKTVFLFDTMCTVRAYGENSQKAVENAVERLADIHKKTDIFSKESEISKINSARDGEKIWISDDIRNILSVALEVKKKSGGAFDISVEPLVSLWNFSGEGYVPTSDEVEKTLKFVQNGEILIEDNLLTKTSAGMKLDLGGVAKGYAGDEAIRVMKKFDISGGIVDLGGNITVMGENPESDNGKWRIGLQKPFAPTGEYDDIIEKTEGAVVTSGTYQRYFERNGERFHHIIDPSTGYPAKRDYNSVTVISDSGLYADCLATACFILGKSEGKELAESFDAEVIFRE